MAAVQALHNLFGINSQGFSKNEKLILEAELLTLVYEELIEIIRNQNKDYFSLIKLSIKKENDMLETSFIRCIINDILDTKEYNLSGIAYYTDTPEEIIYEIAAGFNIRPTFLLGRKLIELHRLVRPNLYDEIINRIIKKTIYKN